MLVVTPMKVTTNLWTSDLFHVAMMSFSFHSCLHCWSHSWIYIWRSVPPCSKANCNINFNIKWFHHNKGCGTTPAEPHVRNVNEGRRPRGGRGSGGSCARSTLETGANFFHLCLLQSFATYSKPYWNPVPMTTFTPNKSKIKPKRHLNCLIPL